jgi:ribosomal protein S27AE
MSEEPVDVCDECGASLAYHGNRWGCNETVCDGCYDRLESLRL